MASKAKTKGVIIRIVPAGTFLNLTSAATKSPKDPKELIKTVGKN